MRLMTREYSFQDYESIVDGVFFYDSDVISDESYVEDIIYEFGVRMDNRVLKKDAHCFFLPKPQSDMLRKEWVPQRINKFAEDILEEMRKLKVLVSDNGQTSVDLCLDIVEQQLSKYNESVKEL